MDPTVATSTEHNYNYVTDEHGNAYPNTSKTVKVPKITDPVPVFIVGDTTDREQYQQVIPGTVTVPNTGTPTQIAPWVPGTRKLVISNPAAAGLYLYIGADANVSNLNGFALNGGSMLELDTEREVYGWVAPGASASIFASYIRVVDVDVKK